MTAGVICGAASLGLICGELVCSSAYRIPAGIKTFASPVCRGCGRKLKWYECIPLFSYIFSGGKRRCCGEKISAARLLMPLSCAALFVVCALSFYDDHPVYAALAAIECSLLFAVAAVDFSHKWIPDRYQIALAVTGGLTFLSETGEKAFSCPISWSDRLLGLAVGGGFFLLIYFGARIILKREGMGFGDVKLAICAGLFIGWKGMLLGVIIGSVSASVILIILRRKNGDGKDTEYPFAPFLATGFALAVFLAEPLINAYLNLLS